MAALALVGTMMTGCASDDINNEAPQAKTNNTVTLTTTISLDGSSVVTRALGADGKKTFAAGDKIAILYKDANDKSQKAISTALETTDITDNGKKAKITVALASPKASGQLRCIYPAAMLSGDFNPDLNPNIDNENTINFPSLLHNQDGTLATIANNYDLAVYDGTFTSDAKLPGSIPLKNQLAIVAFTINDYDGTNDITSTITKLEIDQGPGKFGYTVTRTAAAGPIYVAMMPTKSAKENITISATDVTTTLEKTVKDITLAANNIYPVTAKMQKVVDLSTLTSDYEAKNGEMLTGTLDANVKISIAASATVTLKDANINMDDDGHAKWTSGNYAGITCLGDATIILEGTNKVHAFADNYPGIQAASNLSSPDYTLTIQGDGKLEVTGGKYAAGIGSGKQGKCGNITISGNASINATGGEYGAGIGSGEIGTCSGITISGDATKITATGGAFGAGIGGGKSGNYGNITISGGENIKATGDNGAAGIGNGENTGNNGNSAITITGGKITATGGQSGAGIGSGRAIDSNSSCGDITISGNATITATGGQYAAGIGSGEAYYRNSSCGDITISGNATINATGGEGAAGIGSGQGKDANIRSVCGAITISGGTIIAQGGSGGAGIGSGESAQCSEIKISGGTIIKAQGGGYEGSALSGGAGIGTGDDGICSGGITISGGTIKEANGGFAAAGIGSGGKNNSSSSSANCGDITISGGTIEKAIGSQGSAGIGSGSKSTCKNIVISGGKIELAQGGDWGAGIGSGSDGTCGDITIGKDIIQVTFSKSTDGGHIGKGGNGATCGTVKFDDVTVNINSNPISAGVYGGLTLTCTNYTTYTLTPTPSN